MKTLIKITALSLLLFAVTFTAPQKASAHGNSISFQVFYDELSPYGNWVFYPEYGYVWMPDVAPGFFPYATDGQWVFTGYGWTWVSFYSWGWAPFHYGRWFIDPFYGPMWVPGYEWGPGWVVWRRSADCYGWAPMGPGVTLSFAYGRDYYVPQNHWRFVRQHDFGRPSISNYYIDNSDNITIINNSTVINNVIVDKSRNVTYNGGPDRYEVEKHAGRPVNRVVVNESSKPGQVLKDNELVIYRPEVQKTDAASHKPAPSKVVKLEKTKPAAEKNANVTGQKKVLPGQGNPSGKPSADKQQQHGNTAAKPDAAKKQPQASPAVKPDVAKKQPQGNPAVKPEAVKQKKSSGSSGESGSVKQTQQGGSAGKKEEAKQQQQSSPSKKSAGGKSQQKGSSSKK